MPQLRVTGMNRELLFKEMSLKARLEWEEQSDGSFIANISNRTHRALMRARRPGETLEQCVSRLIDKARRPGETPEQCLSRLIDEKEVDQIRQIFRTTESQKYLKSPTNRPHWNPSWSDKNHGPSSAYKEKMANISRQKPALWENPLEVHSNDLSISAKRSDLMAGFAGKFIREIDPRKKVSLDSNEHDINRQELADIFMSQGLILQKPAGTSIHHYAKFATLIPEDVDAYMFPAIDFSEVQSFVIENDWARPFDKSDITGGDVKLPYPVCCFEFLVTGVRTLLFLREQEDGSISGFVAYGYKREWYTTENADLEMIDGKFRYTRKVVDYDASAWEDFFTRHVRAICIMLEAEVAEAVERDQWDPDSVLAKSNQKKGKKSPRYHVIRLVGRHTRDRHEGSREYKGIVPLHFRRGHWRHFKGPGGQELYVDSEGTTRSRTRIKWMLVGNEDLGFIEKHYKL